MSDKSKTKAEALARKLADQQHAKITSEVERILEELEMASFWKGYKAASQILADALRDARLDEARQWKRRQGDDHGYTYGPHLDWSVGRIVALERGQA